MEPKNDFVDVPVQTQDGLFSSEVLALIQQADGATVSCFVDRVMLKGDRGNFWLRLPVTSRSEKSLTALLPSEALETHSRWIRILTKTA